MGFSAQALGEAFLSSPLGASELIVGLLVGRRSSPSPQKVWFLIKAGMPGDGTSPSTVDVRDLCGCVSCLD